MTAAGPAGAEPLADSLRRLIAQLGPVPLSQFMGEANARYYDSRDPLGAAGDFITAPEISQMFGELIGAWLADIWQRAGAPARACYVELGPGRGTLARDALRVMARQRLTPPVHFVEGSRSLRAVQAAAVPAARFHADLASLPEDVPLLVVANEFFDALPLRQLVMTPAGWRERLIGLEDARFVAVAGSSPMDVALPAGRRVAPVGTIVETCPAAASVIDELARRLRAQGGAALVIDYGHAAPRTGSTLQAVRAHRCVDPLVAPGEADLSAHVDFAALADGARARGARWLGTVGQGAWLRALGIDCRAASLAAAAPSLATAIHGAVERLTGDAQMGALFQVMGLAAPHWPAGAGFAPA